MEREISLSDYKTRKAELDSELAQLQQTKSVSDIRAIQAQTAIDRTDLLRRLREADHLTAELVDQLLDRVEVYPEGKVEPKRKFFP